MTSALARVHDLVRPARTENLAVLLSDMKGFTARTSRQTREENARMLALHDAILLPVLRGYGGRKVKSIGDALLCTFRSPTDCVLCATAMQDRLAAFNARFPSDAIEVRIAISQGEVRVASGDVHGDAVQLALRASMFADAGEVVLTDGVYLAMNKSEVPTELCGTRELRPGEPSRLHRARRGGDAQSPYGGRALRRLGPLPDPVLWLHRKLAARVKHAAAQLARRHGPLLFAGLALFASLAARSVLLAQRQHDPLFRASQLLEGRQPLAALAELDKLNEGPQAKSAEVLVLRAKAEQALGQLGVAFADFEDAAVADLGALDPASVRTLVDDLDSDAFPQGWRGALVRLIGERIGPPAAPELRRLVSSTRARARREALEALELMGRATDDDRVAVARAELSDPASPCAARIAAVRWLGLAADARAVGLLRGVAAEKKRCGAREAGDQLRGKERAGQLPPP